MKRKEVGGVDLSGWLCSGSCIGGVDGVADVFGLADESEDSSAMRRTTNERI